MINSAPIIETALANDPSASEEVKQRVLSVINGENAQYDYISVVQASKLLGCCEASVRRYASRGHLQPVRLSKRSVRYRRDEVLKLRDCGVAV